MDDTNNTTIKRTRADVVFDRINLLVWLLILGVILYPMWIIIAASFSSPEAVIGGKVFLLPVGFSTMGYEAVFQYRNFLRSYANSVFYTVTGTALSVAVTMMAAYALSHKFTGRKVINFFFVFTMFFSGGLVPQFLINKELGLHNTVLIMIIINCVSVWNLMIARTFITSTIPHELYEAAVIDGAGHFTYFFRMVLPLSGTIIAVLVVYYGVARWNDYFTALVYLYGRRDLYPLQTVLKEIVASLQTSASSSEMFIMMQESGASATDAIRKAEVAKYCCIVVSTVPTIVLYTLMQKYFVKGVTLGSLKG